MSGMKQLTAGEASFNFFAYRHDFSEKKTVVMVLYQS